MLIVRDLGEKAHDIGQIVRGVPLGGIAGDVEHLRQLLAEHGGILHRIVVVFKGQFRAFGEIFGGLPHKIEPDVFPRVILVRVISRRRVSALFVGRQEKDVVRLQLHDGVPVKDVSRPAEDEMKGILFLVHVIGDGLEGAALFLSDERRPEPQVQVVLEIF